MGRLARQNPTAQAAKRGELKPRPKVGKPPTKHEESFLAAWERVIMRRPNDASEAITQSRKARRTARRVITARLRDANRFALAMIHERKKAARRKAT